MSDDGGIVDPISFTLKSLLVCDCVIIPLLVIDSDITGFIGVASVVIVAVVTDVRDFVIVVDVSVVVGGIKPIRFTRFAFVKRFGLLTLMLENGAVLLVSSK